LAPHYTTLAASDRLRVLVEELHWEGPTREILRELELLADDLEMAEGCGILMSGSPNRAKARIPTRRDTHDES
jgi:hypothetical protein